MYRLLKNSGVGLKSSMEGIEGGDFALEGC
jgi:hypothetical protein